MLKVLRAVWCCVEKERENCRIQKVTSSSRGVVCSSVQATTHTHALNSLSNPHITNKESRKRHTERERESKMDEFSDFVQSPTVGGGEQQQQQQQDENDDFLARERKAMEEAGLGLKDMGIVNIHTHTYLEIQGDRNTDT